MAYGKTSREPRNSEGRGRFSSNALKKSGFVRGGSTHQRKKYPVVGIDYTHSRVWADLPKPASIIVIMKNQIIADLKMRYFASRFCAFFALLCAVLLPAPARAAGRVTDPEVIKTLAQEAF